MKLEGAELAEFLENEKDKARLTKMSRKSLDSESRYINIIKPHAFLSR